MPTERIPGWQARLTALIASRQGLPFAWGLRDCCTWAADAVMALLGVDPARDERGTYCDPRGAYRLLRRLGGLRGAATRAGNRLDSPRMAIDGDIAIVRCACRPRLGVCAGGTWLVQADVGLFALHFDAASDAWGVGHA